MPNWLGDLVMATPVLADLRKAFPEATITAMAQSNVAQLLQDDPHIDELFSYVRPQGLKRREARKELILTLRERKFDTALLLTHSFSSAWWAWRAGIPHRIGYAGHWRCLLLRPVVPTPQEKNKQHLVLTYKGLLTPLGIPLSDTPTRLYLNDAELAAARHRLGTCGVLQEHTLIGINPGAAFGSAKCWLPERFRAVTERLLTDPTLRVVYFGDQTSASLVEKICEELPDRVINLAGKTSLRELLAMIQLCTVFLTNDSGPMHIAAALGTPLVALFGSTNDTTTGPYGAGPRHVIHKHVSCSPCYKRVCPIDFRCMKSITVEEVYALLKTEIRACARVSKEK